MPLIKPASGGGRAAQQLVQLEEVRDGVAVLSDKTMRAILMVSSINFALKSEDEQNAIIYAFQDFLNSLDFQTQICIVSRKLDIAPYLEELRQRKERQGNELLRMQMDEYINFVSELVKGSDIMTKSFLVVVPFSLQQSRQEGLADKLLKGAQAAAGKPAKLSDEDFTHYKAQLMQRVEQAAIGLRGVGLRVVPLQTQEVLELFYNMFNPVTSRNQRLPNVLSLNIKETDPQNLIKSKQKETPWVKK
jgi:hypothetical protein